MITIAHIEVIHLSAANAGGRFSFPGAGDLPDVELSLIAATPAWEFKSVPDLNDYADPGNGNAGIQEPATDYPFDKPGFAICHVASQ